MTDDFSDIDFAGDTGYKETPKVNAQRPPRAFTDASSICDICGMRFNTVGEWNTHIRRCGLPEVVVDWDSHKLLLLGIGVVENE